MSENWDFYFLHVDNEPASIFFDLGVKRDVPIKSHPYLAYIRIRMRQPREDGLSSREEYDSLAAIEDAFVPSIARSNDSMYVGRNTTGGNRDFFFYVTERFDFERAARKIMASFPEYEFQIGHRPDPEWTTYRDFLFPTERDLLLIRNRRQLDQLERHGDKLDVARPIDHFFCFQYAKDRDLFINFGKSIGYEATASGNDASTALPYSLTLVRSDMPASIDEIALQLFDAIQEMGGDYDGWGCEVVG